MNRALWILAILVVTGCSAEVPAASEASRDHGRDTAFALTDGTAIAAELTMSPVHEAEVAFARVSYLHRSTSRLPIELSTSAEGVTWSEWSAGVVSDEASDEEFGVWVSDLDVVDGEARFWRVRSADTALPTELALVTQTIDEVAADLESADDAPSSEAASAGPEVGAATGALTSFRRYRFDLGRVGRSWLWLLRGARNRGWRGSLYGPRTGLRTYAQQASLWNAYQNGTGAPAFPPWGPSRHLIRNVRKVGTWYQAVDTSDVSGLVSRARNMGVSLHVPYSGESWHVESRRAFGPPRGWNP